MALSTDSRFPSLPAVLILAAASICAASASMAKVPPEEAARLGRDLTPVGAIQAGNDDGTIPPWTGGITVLPAGYSRGGPHPNPYRDDEVLFTITAENAGEYADRLSPGQLAMFRRYPDTWFMRIYPTRRSASYPQRVYDACIANATTAELAGDGNRVIHAREAAPFPIPQSGLEVMWNQLRHFRAESLIHTIGQAAVTPGGSYTEVILKERILYPYFQPGGSTDDPDGIFCYFLQTVTSPARLAGYILLVHDPQDQTKDPRRAWTYNPGQRRVRRAPQIGYDNPGTAADGQRTNDQTDMYNGLPDRYDWTLLGRKEMYIPYNSYEIESLDNEDVLMPGHLNPAHLRYELHRVWVVEGKVKNGMTHIYARRTFYLDEDSWYIACADNYDARGEIWRVSESLMLNCYEVPTVWNTMEVHYDLQNGRYLARGLDPEKHPMILGEPMDPGEFRLETLRQMGRQ